MESIRREVAVVGAGPIGLEMAVALRRAGMDYIHFDARQIGYTISWFAPQTRFFSSSERIAIAGVPLQTVDQSKATREEYLTYLRRVVEQFELDIHTYEPVVGINRDEDEDEFVLVTQVRGHRHRYRARRVILCTGGTDKPRRLDIPGEDLPHVHHYFQDPHTYFRKRVLIVGGKNSAVEAALRCYNVGAEVTISYRREQLNPSSIKYWLLPEINSLIEAGKITAYFNTVPTEIMPTKVRLQATRAATIETEGDAAATSPAMWAADPDAPAAEVEADFILALIGYRQDTTLFELAGIELRGPNHAPAFDERTMESSVPGIYVAGTAVAGTQDKYKVFIENCHVHVGRIMASLTGRVPPPPPPPLARPES